MKSPNNKTSYAVISEKFPNPSVYFDSYEQTLRWAKFEQPAHRPHYIVKRTESFEVCGMVEEGGD